MKFIFGAEKRKILEKLEYYGIEKLPFFLMRFGKDKIRGYSGMFSTEEIEKISQSVRIELAGLYLFHEYDDGIRLSLDASHLLKDQITKNIIELNEQEKNQWFKGNDLDFKEEWKTENKGFKIVMYNGDFIGTGKLTDNRLVNYLPKERRTRN